MGEARWERGWVYEYECTDKQCWECTQIKQMNRLFGECYAMHDCPDQSVMFNCGGGNPNFVKARWDNPSCDGVPKDVVRADQCYTRPFSHYHSNSKWCKSGNEYEKGKWYTYECVYSFDDFDPADSWDWDDDPQIQVENGDVQMDSNSNIHVGIAM